MKIKPGTELIFGIHPLIELLKAKRRKLLVVYTTKPAPKSFKTIESLLAKGTQIQYVSRSVLNSLAGTADHQGVVGFASPFQFKKQFFDSKTHPFLLMLDGIQDVRNLGAILRSAYCIGIDGVIITQRNSAPLNATALKACAGLAEHMLIYQTPSSSSALIELNKQKYTVYLAVMDGQNALTITYQKPLCLVIGSEQRGIAKEILSQGIPVTLPQKTPDISYNASAAASLLLFWIKYGKS